MKLLYRLAVVLLVAIVAVWVWHGSRSQRSLTSTQVYLQLMSTIDTNGDHRISRREWSQYSHDPAPFIKYDTNDDGYLDVKEFARMFRGTSPSLPVAVPRVGM